MREIIAERDTVSSGVHVVEEDAGRFMFNTRATEAARLGLESQTYIYNSVFDHLTTDVAALTVIYVL